MTNYSKRSQTPKYGKMADPNLDKGDFVFALNDPSALENNIEALELDRKNLERERQGLADERKRLELETLLAEAKRKLEEEKRRLAEELEKLARLQPPKAEAKPSPGPAGMVKIPGGEYVAGLDPDLALAECRKYYGKCKREWFTDETPAMRTVESFSMDKYEVTQAEFEKVMGNNPSGFKGPNLPVENVTWHEADEYCRKVGEECGCVGGRAIGERRRMGSSAADGMGMGKGGQRGKRHDLSLGERVAVGEGEYLRYELRV